MAPTCRYILQTYTVVINFTVYMRLSIIIGTHLHQLDDKSIADAYRSHTKI